MLLHYLVKCTTHYYCTVNNKFHVVPNDQQTLLQFIDILNPQLVDILLILLQIVYATRLREGLFNVVIWTLVVAAPETKKPDSLREHSVSERCPAERKKNFSGKYNEWHTHMWASMQVKGGLIAQILWQYQ